MRSSYDLPPGRVNLSRRRILLSGAVIMAGGGVTSALLRFALAASSTNFIPFMPLSRPLVNHQLGDGVGQRLLAQACWRQPRCWSG
ncbi:MULTISPECIES: sugar dehydrogenase complex small subunit [Pantoea]|uniref:sugar dehydrogenase complex small subunit n=1 Tax=Pantoea TaxID=53335 RepID=UPI000ED1508E|nr:MULTISPECIES: sugar dehydrogenase complex small subunit [Pantoea]HAB74903.1 hypothetical protein [Pantoea sp.]